MRKAFLAVLAVAALVGCTPTTPPGTSSTTTTTPGIPAGLREVYLPNNWTVAGQNFPPSELNTPRLSIDSAKYPANAVLTVGGYGARLSYLPAPFGPTYGMCVELFDIASGQPVGDESCAEAPVVEVFPGFGAVDTPQRTLAGPLKPGDNKYGVRTRPAPGFTCVGDCSLTFLVEWVRISW